MSLNHPPPSYSEIVDNNPMIPAPDYEDHGMDNHDGDLYDNVETNSGYSYQTDNCCGNSRDTKEDREGYSSRKEKTEQSKR